MVTIDVETKQTREVSAGFSAAAQGLSRDGRVLVAVRADTQAEIWMLSPTGRADSPE